MYIVVIVNMLYYNYITTASQIGGLQSYKFLFSMVQIIGSVKRLLSMSLESPFKLFLHALDKMNRFEEIINMQRHFFI